MGDKQEVAAELLLRPLAEELLLFRLEVAVVGDLLLELFGDDLLRVHELHDGDRADLGELRVQKRDLFGIVLFQKVHDVAQRARLHVHDVVKAVDEPHLEVHADILVEVAGGVVMLRTEHGPDLEHALVDGDEHLFIELRALRQKHLLAEIVELEDIRAALRALCADLGRADLGESLRKEIFAEPARYPLLHLEHGALLGVAQRHGAQVEVEVDGDIVELFFVDDKGHLFGGRREHVDAVDLHLKPSLARLVFDDLAREFDRAPLGDLFAHAVVRKIGGIDALHRLARGADDDERKPRHLADAVNDALHADGLADVRREILVADAVRPDLAVDRIHLVCLSVKNSVHRLF